jgi:hypothetical protein
MVQFQFHPKVCLRKPSPPKNAPSN